MHKFLLPALIAGLATSFAGLATSAIAQSDAAPRRFAVTGFDAIDLSGSDSIRVLPGATLSVIADGDPRAVAALAIDVRDGTLRVGRKPGNWRDQGARITVTLPRLRAARISGSGDIRVGAVAGRDFTGSISGSGTLAVTDLDAETARFALPRIGDDHRRGACDAGRHRTRRIGTDRHARARDARGARDDGRRGHDRRHRDPPPTSPRAVGQHPRCRRRDVRSATAAPPASAAATRRAGSPRCPAPLRIAPDRARCCGGFATALAGVRVDAARVAVRGSMTASATPGTRDRYPLRMPASAGIASVRLILRRLCAGLCVMNRFALLSLYRSLTRHKLYAALNIGGLAVGIAVFLVLGLYVRFETSYEKWLPRSRRRSICVRDECAPARATHSTAPVPGDDGRHARPDARRIFPNVVGTRSSAAGAGGGSVLRGGIATKRGRGAGRCRVLPTCSTCRWCAATGARALADPTGALISRRRRSKYFGSSDPVGQTMTIVGRCARASIASPACSEDLPKNSELQISILMPMPRTPPASVGVV